MTALSSLVLSMTGGRLGVRRCPSFRWIALCLLAGALPAAAQTPTPEITVREVGGVFAVAATFDVARPPDRILAVLGDYARIPDLVPDVKRSIVRSRQGDRLIVEQEAVSRVLFFSKTVHLTLDVHETAAALVFRDTCGRSFVVYEGAWHVSAIGGGSRVRYELRAQPAFDVPDFLVKRLMRRDAGQLIARLRAAMES